MQINIRSVWQQQLEQCIQVYASVKQRVWKHVSPQGKLQIISGANLG